MYIFSINVNRRQVCVLALTVSALGAVPVLILTMAVKSFHIAAKSLPPEIIRLQSIYPSLENLAECIFLGGEFIHLNIS